MQTSATGTSTEPRLIVHSGRQAPQRGFTLVELLVVITIMAVVVGIAVLSVGVSFREPEDMEKETLRLSTLLELSSEEALFQGRTFGLVFEERGYQFYEWNNESVGWLAVEGDVELVARDLPEDLFFTLVVEDREVELKRRRRDSDEATIRPHVALLPTGEMTPFTVSVNREFTEKYFTLTAEADGTVQIEEFDPDAF